MNANELMWRLNRRLRQKQTLRTHQGLYTVRTDDIGVGRELIVHGAFEFDLMQEVSHFGRQKGWLSQDGSGAMLDIGANIGITCISLLLAGIFSRAVAIEPDADNFALLERNVRQNGLGDRILCVRLAVGDREGEVTLERSRKNLGDHRIRLREAGISTVPDRFDEAERTTVTVPMSTVDAVVMNLPWLYRERIEMIWMDVQGAEGFALLGACETQQRSVMVVSELWPYGLVRSGMTENEFVTILRNYCSELYRIVGADFVCEDVEDLRSVINEIGYAGEYETIVFQSKGEPNGK